MTPITGHSETRLAPGCGGRRPVIACRDPDRHGPPEVRFDGTRASVFESRRLVCVELAPRRRQGTMFGEHAGMTVVGASASLR